VPDNVPGDPDPRVPVTARIRRSSRDRLDEIAAEHDGWGRTEALRHLLALGMAAYDADPARVRARRGREQVSYRGKEQQ
jgi:hypothetical protein